MITLLIVQLSPLCCYLVPNRPKYLPQQPILKQPQPAIFGKLFEKMQI